MRRRFSVPKNVECLRRVHCFDASVVWYELVETMTSSPLLSYICQLTCLLVGRAYFYYFPDNPPSSTPVSTLISASFFRVLPSSLDAMLPHPCLSADLVLNRGDWKILFTSPLYVHNSLHAAYSFLTLMFLGRRYERSMGAARFAIRVVCMTAVTGLLYCWLARILAQSDIPELEGVCRYEMQHKCFTGATAAILALKVSFGIDDGVPAEDDWFGGLWPIPPGRYPFLWFTLPIHPVVAAFIEAHFVDGCFPFLWSTGHVAGLAAGIGYAIMDFAVKKLV